MSKILISSLGTGTKKDGYYQTATYELNTKQYETSFVTDALYKHLEIDKIFLVGTNKSIWDEAYFAFGGKDEEYQDSLYEKQDEKIVTIETLKKFTEILPDGSKSFIIKYGINDDELWNNFEKFLEIANHIEDGDELYLDITHSFRSLSLMSFVMTQFASSISDKKFKIAGVYYGMFEYSQDNQGITPIVDIKILLDIQEWIKAIDAIKKYSDFDPLVRLLEDEGIETNVGNTFIQLNNTLEMANIAALYQFVNSAAKKIKLIQDSKNKIIKLLAPEVLKLVEELNQDKLSNFQYVLAKWFYKNKNYALSYIALYEAIISKSCELKGYDLNEHNLRENAKKSIGNDKYGKYFYTKHADSISQIRNNIAHQSNARKDKVLQDIEKLQIFIKTFEPYFEI